MPIILFSKLIYSFILTKVVLAYLLVLNGINWNGMDMKKGVSKALRPHYRLLRNLRG
jgi:hypothetical protein